MKQWDKSNAEGSAEGCGNRKERKLSLSWEQAEFR